MPVEMEMALRILPATALGGVIGFQRERLDKPAGFRTHILMAAGAGLYIISVAATVIFLAVLLLPRVPVNHREDNQTEKIDDTG